MNEDYRIYSAIGEYSNACGRFGPGSPQAREVIERHRQLPHFLEYVQALDRVKLRLGGSGVDYPPRRAGRWYAPWREWRYGRWWDWLLWLPGAALLLQSLPVLARPHQHAGAWGLVRAGGMPVGAGLLVWALWEFDRRSRARYLKERRGSTPTD